ncbi:MULTISPECIES: ABC transporter ATP-binding protein [Streptomyces]|uniref:ABC transporter ATP-binding protein n=1 Tax=Streptomyces coelicolor (strain ATCC BAA-471 / A3(2) / M145) TaxID=100226 RepID=Q9EWN7_STRCO|nr:MULTISPECIES: ABC transporter ATP-binding protein [Streptomyces]MDX2924246.1 ABC transporter ATP-binding protein [Streptomyces sp. NRRL_B-16638]MDX3411523.1 ABC transporter ATP-binding protein [Streptomyces sp. ME02-6977A]MYU47192.1 ATP-binding cassette domain-containing protein [Streptomyces sp. SID7813]NSL80405.1 ABC transporter ATP-binding protein [Streptomyces coelicolor]QFI47406.1 ABC transporter ATP-binding protein [Streptomyces coelicolor A3(2)]
MIRQLYRVLGPEGSRPLNRLLVLQCAAAVLQGVAFALLVPVLRALLGPAPDDVWPWLTAFAGCALAHAVLQGAAVSGGFTVGSQLSRVLHQRMADQALRLPLGWFDAGRTAEFSRLAGQNVIQVMSTPAHLLRPFISSLLTPATLVLATFFFDVRTALVLLVCAPVLFAVQAASSAVMRRLDLGRDAAIGESADRVLEYARNQPVLRAFGRTAEGYGALDEALVAEARADRRLIARGLPGLVSFSFATRLVFALLLALGVSWQLDGSLTVATLLALLVLLVRLIDSVSSAAEAGAGMRIARNTLERLGALLDEPPFPQPAEPRTPRDASVEFDKVGFRYDGGADPVAGAAARPVLNDVTFRLPERSMTALVGPSGAGKTTIAGLLARFRDTTEGTVRIGGVDVREIGADDLADHVSLVFQDVYLFDGTIEENVRIAAPHAYSGQLAEAAALSGLDRVVEELPEGWAMKVGEGGARLSGGQRQRVSIARALLKDAPILVLDEATAALDQENEALFAQAVRALAARRTLLVIAHRLSTVVGADQILVLEDGEITERGTHDDLVAAAGTYASFWERRAQAHGWRLESAPS